MLLTQYNLTIKSPRLFKSITEYIILKNFSFIPHIVYAIIELGITSACVKIIQKRCVQDIKILFIYDITIVGQDYYYYLHDCFLIVIPAHISNQVYTNVERNINGGRYSHNLSPGLRNL
jgi:hypothetical protein